MSGNRAQRLDMVLTRALEVSGNSLDEEDLAECFGSIKTQFGPQMQRLFSNMMTKVDSNIETQYKDICIRRDLDERLTALSKLKSNEARIVDSSVKNAVDSAVDEIKTLETESLNAANKTLEADLKQLTSRAGRLKASVENEMNALSKEKENTFSSNQR